MLHYNMVGVADENGYLVTASDHIKGPVGSAEIVVTFEEGFSKAKGEVDKMVLHRKTTPRCFLHPKADNESGANDFRQSQRFRS